MLYPDEKQIPAKTTDQIYHAWTTAWANNDVDGLLALYAEDVIVESPLIPYLLGISRGICEGKEAFRRLLKIAAKRKPTNRQYYRNSYFTDGKTLIWEYPRVSPDGEQMDFVEVMELRNGLISRHRVYWGWFGFDILKNDKYHRQSRNE